jgi:type VII secretion integral membrane protein EccD
VANVTPATTTTVNLCRLTVRAPDRTFELAVPVDVQLMDLLPTVVGYAGDDLDEAGLAHGGWVLQRLGEEPLDEENTPDGLGLRDGDTLYLRPRQDALPPVHFDDLVDSVAGTLRERPDTWRPEFSRRTLLAALLLLLATGVALLALGGSREPRAAVAAFTGVLLLAGAASASRAMGDAVTGTALGAAAVPFLALAGALVPPGGGDGVVGARLLAGAAAAAAGAALAVAVSGAAAPLFLGIGLAALLTAVQGVVMLAFGAPLGHAAALVTVLDVLAGVFVPATAFRLSGLRLPPLPGNADQLQEGIEPHDAADVVRRSALVDTYATACYLAIGAVAAAGLTGMLRAPGAPGYALIAALGALGVLHGSRLGGVWPRLALTVPGLYGLLLLAVRIGVTLSPAGRLLEFTALLLASGALALASWTVPGRRVLPHWAHAVNVLHSLAAVSLLPLALWVFGLYHYLRGLGG